METNNIQTRKDEIRFFTNKPEEMLGKFPFNDIITGKNLRCL